MRRMGDHICGSCESHVVHVIGRPRSLHELFVLLEDRHYNHVNCDPMDFVLNLVFSENMKCACLLLYC